MFARCELKEIALLHMFTGGELWAIVFLHTLPAGDLQELHEPSRVCRR